MKRIMTLSLLLLTVITLAGCKPVITTNEHIIYTTVYPMEYLVDYIGGDTVIVERVPGSSSGGHSDGLYWTGKEIISMLNSDFLFYLDGGFDTYISNSLDSVFNAGDVELINMSEHIEYDQVCYDHDHEHGEEKVLVDTVSACDESMLSDDPHFWLDPQKMLEAALLVKDTLVEAFPDHIGVYEENYSNLEFLLTKLDTDFTEMAEAATKPIITTNMLFNYWYSTYDLEIISLSLDAHNSEVVPTEVIEFVDEAVFHEVHYILFEVSSNSPTGDLVLQQLLLQDPTAQAANLHNLANLTLEQQETEASYLTLMYENLAILELATK